MPDKAWLALEDGLVVEGVSFGAAGEMTGELVFNTSMTGYQEILTDPSYRGQVVMMTYPLIGNYGVNPRDTESDRVQASGFVVREVAAACSNHQATASLPDYLAAAGVPGISGVDTRMLTVRLREKGSLKALVTTRRAPGRELVARAGASPDMAGRDLASDAGCRSPRWHAREGGEKVVVLDCGVKRSILEAIAARGKRVLLVPALTPAEEIIAEKPARLVVSNGPGDPAALSAISAELARLLGRLPITGICLGHQLLALAAGGRTEKLKFGHHGANHPVREEATGRVLITAQNHGFCVREDTLPPGVEITHRNLNDGSVEGLSCAAEGFFSVQFHPEAGPGPNDARPFFDLF